MNFRNISSSGPHQWVSYVWATKEELFCCCWWLNTYRLLNSTLPHSLHLLTTMLIFETSRHLKKLSICIDSCPLAVIWEALVGLKFHKISNSTLMCFFPEIYSQISSCVPDNLTSDGANRWTNRHLTSFEIDVDQCRIDPPYCVSRTFSVWRFGVGRKREWVSERRAYGPCCLPCVA